MTFTKFPDDQKYTLNKILRVADDESPAGETARHYWIIPVNRPRRIIVQAITRNNTNMNITLGGNLYGIDADYSTASNEDNFTNNSNDIHNFFEISSTPLTTNRGVATVSTDIPMTHLSLELEAQKRNQRLNVIAYVMTV